MTTPENFELALDTYQGTTGTCPPDIASSNYFFAYWDTLKLYADCIDKIDCLDWSKIHLSIQPVAALTSNSGGVGTTQSDID